MIRVAALWARFAPWTIANAIRVLATAFVGDGERGERIQREWAEGVLEMLGARFEPEFSRPAPGPGPWVVMANHESLLDPPLLISHLGIDHLRFVAKASLFKVPIFGQGMAALGHIPIDRGRRDRAIANLRRAGERIRAGTSILIFPEGTRNDGRGAMRPFKKGGFLLAIEAGVPILPVAVIGTARILSKDDWAPRAPGPVRILTGDPIPTAGLTVADRDALMARTRAAIEALIEEGAKT